MSGTLGIDVVSPSSDDHRKLDRIHVVGTGAGIIPGRGRRWFPLKDGGLYNNRVPRCLDA